MKRWQQYALAALVSAVAISVFWVQLQRLVDTMPRWPQEAEKTSTTPEPVQAASLPVSPLYAKASGPAPESASQPAAEASEPLRSQLVQVTALAQANAEDGPSVELKVEPAQGENCSAFATQGTQRTVLIRGQQAARLQSLGCLQIAPGPLQTAQDVQGTWIRQADQTDAQADGALRVAPVVLPDSVVQQYLYATAVVRCDDDSQACEVLLKTGLSPYVSMISVQDSAGHTLVFEQAP